MEKFLVTGASGYIGSMLVRHISASYEDAVVTAAVRDRRKCEGRFPAGVFVLEADLCDEAAVSRIEGDFDYVIHCASITKSSEMAARPVEVIQSIVNTAQNVLNLVRQRHVKSLVYLSSMEVYGAICCSEGHRVREEEAADGAVDLLSVRSCYPLGKRMAENLCYSYYKEYGLPIKIARLAQTFGEGTLPTDSRVFMQFAKAAKDGTDIILHTEGNSVGNYCGIHDAIAGILTILKRGVNGEAYNVVNEQNTMTIRQMAELVAEKIAGDRIQIRYDIPSENIYGYAPDTGLRLSGKKLESLGWHPSESLEKMYREVIRG